MSHKLQYQREANILFFTTDNLKKNKTKQKKLKIAFLTYRRIEVMRYNIIYLAISMRRITSSNRVNKFVSLRIYATMQTDSMFDMMDALKNYKIGSREIWL